MNQRIDDLRKLSQAIEATASAVSAKLQEGCLTLDEQIAIGHLLDAMGKSADKALDPIKKALREKAIQQHPNPGTIFLNSNLGSTCMVVIPKTSVQVRKDINMDALKSILGSHFDTFFETLTTYKPRPGFESRTASCNNHDERQAILDAVKVEEGTPRVSFKE